MKDSELILQAAEELASLIADKNIEALGKICHTDLDPPDLHDYQTCHELQKLAKKLKEQDA